MAQIDNALEYLHDLDRGARFTALKFDDIFNSLQVCAVRKGFSNEILHELVTLWLKIKIPVTKWSSLGYCLIPEGKVADNTVLAVIHWILNNHFVEEYNFRTTAALNWLTGLLDYNLINTEVLDPYYEFFFFLLYNDKLLFAASKLVYNFTKSYDVRRTKVISILNLIETKRSPRHYNCLLVLLSLFKSYRPECVPEDVPMISSNTTFSKPNKLLMERLEVAQIRSNIQLNLSPSNRLTWWTGESGTRNFRKQNTIHLLPDVDYLQLGSTIYMRDGDKKKCLDFTSTHDLLVYHYGNKIMIPANILSLLVNDAGLHILQFSDPQSQSRLSQTLYHTLYNNFLRSKTNLTVHEKTHFLNRVSMLQIRLQQGIPVVSRFLSQFISSWNGADYFNEILELLEWLSFESFEELYDLILEYIESLFLTNDILYRCTILDTLKKMYINIHKMMTSKRKLLFLSRTRINDVEILNNFSMFIDELCEKSLNTFPESIALRHCFLDVYDAMADLQVECNEPLWSVVPTCLAYNVLCSHNAYSINRILGLFLKYRVIYGKIKACYGKEMIKYQITLAESYSTDFVNCLWYGKSITWGYQGLMMNKLPHKLMQQLDSDIDKFDTLLDIKHHIAFVPFTINTLSSPDYADGLDKEFWLERAISPNFDNIPKFLKAVVSQADSA